MRKNAFNFHRLPVYNFDFLSLDEVVLLEYFIFHHLRGTMEVIVPSRISKETGVTRGKQPRILDSLKEKNFIDMTFNGYRYFFSLNAEQILQSLDKIFVKPHRYAYEYYFLLQRIEVGEGIEEKPQKKPIKKVKKTVKKGEPAVNQMSLFG